jgi:phenylalanine-4-hydroxylase
MTQNYNAYTEEDFLVWKTLFERQMKNLEPVVSKEYLLTLQQAEFTADKIPDFEYLNVKLKNTTGWELVVVPNIVPQKEFFELLAEKKFPATTWLRKMHQLDYLEEPDMFHDVFGHVPLLFNHAYTGFFKGMADIALKHINNEKVIEALGRLYWFTIEFGLIREDNTSKIFGAGIISSKGETLHCMSDNVTRLEFDVRTLMQTGFINSEIQNKYFITPSYTALFNSLEEIELTVNELILNTELV